MTVTQQDGVTIVTIETSSQTIDYVGTIINYNNAGGAVISVNGETGAVVLNQDEILDGTTNKQFSQAEKTKLAAQSGTNTGDNSPNSLYSGLAASKENTGVAAGLVSTHESTYNHSNYDDAYAHSLIITGNPHNVTKSDVGLGNVDNTSDANKPVSNATQTALNAKQDSLGYTPEDVANLRTSFQVTPDDTHYISEKLAKDSLDGKQPTGNYFDKTNDTLDDISDVIINTPIAGQGLLYNGSEFINSDLPTTGGSTPVSFYFEDTPSGIGAYNSLFGFPSGAAEDIDTAVVNSVSGEVLIEGYITEQLGRTVLQGGLWEFNVYTKVSAISGVTQLVYRVYRYQVDTTETELFNCVSDEINNTSVELSICQTVQTEFATWLATDRLLVKVYAKTTSVPNVTVSFYHNGTAHYSHFHTPLLRPHNETAEIQGGSAAERYHLTAAQHTIATQAATASLNGYATAAQITKLDSIETNADVTDDVNVGTSIHGVADKSTLHDNDKFAIIDTEASNVLKTTTWTNIKSKIASYYDGLISSITALKTFSKDKFAMLGTGTGKNIISTANTSATDYTNTLPAKDGTIAMTSDIPTIVVGNILKTILVQGEIKVPSAGVDVIPPFLEVNLATGQSQKIIALSGAIESGTHVELKVQKSDGAGGAFADVSGFTLLTISGGYTNPTSYNPADVALSAGEVLQAVVTAVSGTPKNLMLNAIIEDTRTLS